MRFRSSVRGARANFRLPVTTLADTRCYSTRSKAPPRISGDFPAPGYWLLVARRGVTSRDEVLSKGPSAFLFLDDRKKRGEREPTFFFVVRDQNKTIKTNEYKIIRRSRRSVLPPPTPGEHTRQGTIPSDRSQGGQLRRQCAHLHSSNRRHSLLLFFVSEGTRPRTSSFFLAAGWRDPTSQRQRAPQNGGLQRWAPRPKRISTDRGRGSPRSSRFVSSRERRARPGKARGRAVPLASRNLLYSGTKRPNQNKSLFFLFSRILASRTHLVSSATVLEQSRGTSRRLEDTGSFPMSTRSRILDAEGGGEGDVDMSLSLGASSLGTND